ncbi:DUF6435 family protein [Reinekea sp. G2M2-21]|uniref:DUF6435 family protein n=1 Tax=Reinekea sp. G2M2-21 TaxID=2788942 RepID=UPI0018A8C164|nr:DUF6435 family protein [Reinekea sp. G2M2-21]
MFAFLKTDPAKKLQKEFNRLSEKAFHAQRNGDIRGYSELTSEAEAYRQKIKELQADEDKSGTA